MTLYSEITVLIIIIITVLIIVIIIFIIVIVIFYSHHYGIINTAKFVSSVSNSRSVLCASPNADVQ